MNAEKLLVWSVRGLYEDIGEGGNRHLKSCRQADLDDLSQNIPVDSKPTKGDTNTSLATHQGNHHENGGEALRKNGGKRYTEDTHIECQYENQIQNRIGKGAQRKKIEGTARVSHRTQNSRANVVDHQTKES